MIRLLTSQDSKEFRHLRLQSLQTDPQAFVSTFDYEVNLSIEHFQNRIHYSTKQPHYGIYGKFQDSKLIGMIQFGDEFLPKIAHRANIYELYVDPKHRHQHLGTDLISHVIKAAQLTPRLEQLLLRVNSTNQAAINLYKKSGFELISTHPKAIKEDDDNYQDELTFLLFL